MLTARLNAAENATSISNRVYIQIWSFINCLKIQFLHQAMDNYNKDMQNQYIAFLTEVTSRQNVLTIIHKAVTSVSYQKTKENSDS